MKQTYIDWKDLERYTHDIIRQMTLDNWRPDYIVGITRGGLAPAVLISQYLDVPMHTLKVSLRHGQDCESNCWMAEDAFGYIPATDNDYSWTRTDASQRKRILLVDDINDSGATFNWIRRDWQSSCFPDQDGWAEVWGDNVRIAVLVDNQSSDCELAVSYSAIEVNKLEDPQWIVFPWEEWWLNSSRTS